MERIEMTVSTDELLGLQALAVLDQAGDGQREAEGLASTAGLMMREGLEARLREAGLPWAPSQEAVAEYEKHGGQLQPNEYGIGSALKSTLENRHIRWIAFAALGIATLVVLLGGYGAKWSWTGFESNNQLWDWMHLLLLPVAFGMIPLWLRFSGQMTRIRKATFAALILAFVGFVIAGYLVPIKWTGFKGNTLWDWLTLIVLPVTLVTIQAWPASPREVRKRHVAVFSALSLAWVVTLVGGYVSTWKWTGYPGNTLWDWLQLLLAPLVIVTVVAPAAARWVSGREAARLDREAEAKAQAARRSSVRSVRG